PASPYHPELRCPRGRPNAGNHPKHDYPGSFRPRRRISPPTGHGLRAYSRPRVSGKAGAAGPALAKVVPGPGRWAQPVALLGSWAGVSGPSQFPSRRRSARGELARLPAAGKAFPENVPGGAARARADAPRYQRFDAAGGKFDYVRRLAGALCYVGMVRLDGIELHPFSNKLGRRFLCTGGRHRFGPVLDSLGAMEAGGQTDFFAVLREFITRYSQRGLVIVISDFLDDQGCERALQFLADFGHELMLLQIWSVEDRTPPWDGELELEDAETGGRLKVQFDQSARARYTQAFDE